MKTLTLSSIFLLACFSACQCDIDQLKSLNLKYESGYHIGDVVLFDSKRFKLNRQREIFVNDKKVGIISNCLGDKIEIQSNTGEKGFYLKNKL